MCSANGELVTVSATDPLNLVGFIVPGERIAAISGKHVTFRDGVAMENENQASADQTPPVWAELPGTFPAADSSPPLDQAAQ